MCVIPVGAANDKILLPSQLNADPKAYDEKTVLVKGYAIFGSHEHVLLESRERDIYNRDAFARKIHLTAGDNEQCLTIINPEFLSDKGRNYRRFMHYTFVLKGKFFAHYSDQVVDLGACPIASGFAIEKVIRAHK